MALKNITLDEAKKVIEDYYNEEDFITSHVRGWTGIDGEYNDNSIELCDYYRNCKAIVDDFLATKHG